MNKKLLIAVGFFVLGLTLTAYQTISTVSYIDANAVEFNHGRVLGASTVGLVGHWKFDDIIGTTAVDSSGSSHNGTLVNAPTWGLGQIDGGLDLNSGTTKNQYVSLPNIISPDSDITISVWANVRSAGFYSPFIAKGTTIYRLGADWGFWIYPGGNLEARRGGGYTMSTSKVSFNSWHNYAVVMSASNTSIYIDGVRVTTAAGLPTTSVGGNTGMAGWGGNGNLDGTLDDVRVYNRALSASEIMDINNSGGGTVVLSDTTPPVISSVNSSSVTTSSATVSWSTDESSDTQVEYGLTTSYGSTSSLDATPLTSHSVSISSLASNTSYHFRVKSKDSAGNLSVSSDYTFATAEEIVLGSVPVISSFTASPLSVLSGESGVLSWQISGATSASIDNGVGSLSNLTSGSASVYPSQSTSYRLTASNSAGGVSSSVVVSVSAPVSSTSQIVSSRPRLYEPSYIELLKNKKNGTAEQKLLWSKLDTYINSYCTGTAYGVEKSFGCMDPLTMAYTLDNTKTDYAVKACELMAFNLNGSDGDARGMLDDDTDIKSGNSLRWYGPSLALTYDLLYDVCTDAQKSVAKDAFTRAWNIYNQNSTVAYGKWWAITAPAKISNNIAIGQLNTVVRMAIAAYDPVNFPQADTWMKEIVDIFRTRALLCTKNSTAIAPYESCFGGAWPEGVEYSPETKKLFMDALEAIRAGTGGAVNLFNESGQIAEQILNYHLITTSPTGKQGTYNKLYEAYPYRDVQKSGYLYTVDRQLMISLSRYFQRVGDATRLGYTQWWLNNIQPKHYLLSNSNGGLEMAEFLNYDPNASTIPYLGSISTDLMTPFMLVSRSDISENATWAGFQAMIEGADHMHGDAGQYQIYRKGEWLTQEIPGYLGPNYVQASASHNTPLLNWHGSFSGANRGGNSDGWAKFTRTTNGWRSECNSSYCYAQADLTPAYRFIGYRITPDVQKVTRDFLYLKPDIFVVADNYQYVDGLNAMSINPIQSQEPIAVSGNRATISKGSQRLFVNVVAPTQPKFQTIKQDSCKVIGAKKIDSNNMDIYVDCYYGAANQNVTISGATGEWSAVNGSWVETQPQSSQTIPYSDGGAYNGERFRIKSTTNAFSSISSAWPYELSGVVTTSLVKDIKVNGLALNAYRLDVSSGQYTNKESHFYVMQSADSTTVPTVVSDRSTASANAGQFGDYIVATAKDPSIVGDIEYGINGTGAPIKHYVFGLSPQSSYQVITSAPGKITIRQSGTYTASASGMLTFQTEGSTVIAIDPINTNDSIPPTIPTNLSATSTSSSQINLTWTASTDNVGVAGYKIFRGGAQVGTSATSSYSSTGLLASTAYSFTVAAYDAAGNVSAQSAAAAATTQIPPVVLPVISNLVGSNTTATSTKISWNTNILTDGQISYGTTTSYGLSSSLLDSSPKTTAHTATLAPLSPDTTYHFRVTSVDALGNKTVSADFTFATLSNTPIIDAPVISAFTASPAVINQGSSAVLSFIVTGNPTTLTISNNVGSVLGQTSKAVSPTVTTTYTLTATNRGGTATAQATVTITSPGVTPPPASTSTAPSISSFAANPAAITPGQSTGLSWVVSGSPTPTISIDNGLGLQAGTNIKAVPTVTTTYTLTATNSGGTATAQVKVIVNAVLSGGSILPGRSGTGASGNVVVYIPPAAAQSNTLNPNRPKLINNQGTYYLIQNNQRQGITSPGILYSYGFDFGDAVSATAEDSSLPEGQLLLPPIGSLVRSKENPTVYLITQDQRRGFVSEAVFKALGFKFSSVLLVTDPELQALPQGDNLSNPAEAHPAGFDINHNGTVYWIAPDFTRQPYPSLDVYNSWHRDGDFTQVVPANSADLELPVGEMVMAREQE